MITIEQVLEVLKKDHNFRDIIDQDNYYYSWTGVTKLHRQRKNGNGQEKNIWTDVELTKAEEKTLIWLAGWEESTVDNLLSVIEKAARIRAEKKGGYAHKSKHESEK